MGQYYRAVMGNTLGTKFMVFDRTVDGEYTMAKLMEHAWWDNPFVNSFSEKLYESNRRVLWVGDYANEPDDFKFSSIAHVPAPCYEKVWGDGVLLGKSFSTDFTLDNRFLIDYDTKQYVDLNEYKAASADSHGWSIHPIPLLTAVGNDRGGGDFHEGGVGYEHVGKWAWHLLTIRDYVPKSYTKFELVFKER